MACLLLIAVGASAAAEDDGVDLTVVYGVSPGEVRLDWTGGSPLFRVYRATSPVDVDVPAHLLGTTVGALWLDSPPAGQIFYYSVHPPCTTVPFCDSNEFCSAGVCLPDQLDGSVCSSDDDCTSGHCDNGYCCASGVCCATALDCGAFADPSACDDQSSCQGGRLDGVCVSNQCSSNQVADDSGCAGLVSQTCGLYPSVHCTAGASQPANQAALCNDACADDPDCDASAHCDAAVCLTDVAQGGSCDEPSDCDQGLPCADAVCCNSGCAGVCSACDLSGAEGTCSLIPSGQDPDAECPALGCVGFYHSWSGDSCRRKADLASTDTTCNGAGACLTQAQECAAQTVAGPTTITCHANCQDPNLATCTGTTAGACTNVNPGTQTCGLGACLNTVNQCSNGAPLTCTPGTPGMETCNNIDDNCDGTVDNGSFADGFEANSTCASFRVLNGVGSDQTASYGSSMTVYPQGDLDYYRILATESDSSCGCGAFSFDEDYQFKATLTVPTGAGTYEVCLNNGGCGSFSTCLTVAQGTSGTVFIWLDGECPGQDDYTVYVRVRGLGAPGFECLPYSLSYTFDAGLCN
ncbi:MAG: hypothetical protein ACREAA_07440 [Candidatus Polarisedimenticolia bacterium]